MSSFHLLRVKLLTRSSKYEGPLGLEAFTNPSVRSPAGPDLRLEQEWDELVNALVTTAREKEAVRERIVHPIGNAFLATEHRQSAASLQGSSYRDVPRGCIDKG